MITQGGPLTVEGYLQKIKRHVKGGTRTNWRYCKFSLDEKEKAFTMKERKEDLKFIHAFNIKQIRGLKENETLEKTAGEDRLKFGFTLTTTVKNYTLFTMSKDEYNSWTSVIKTILKGNDGNVKKFKQAKTMSPLQKTATVIKKKEEVVKASTYTDNLFPANDSKLIERTMSANASPDVIQASMKRDPNLMKAEELAKKFTERLSKIYQMKKIVDVKGGNVVGNLVSVEILDEKNVEKKTNVNVQKIEVASPKREPKVEKEQQFIDVQNIPESNNQIVTPKAGINEFHQMEEQGNIIEAYVKEYEEIINFDTASNHIPQPQMCETKSPPPQEKKEAPSTNVKVAMRNNSMLKSKVSKNIYLFDGNLIPGQDIIYEDVQSINENFLEQKIPVREDSTIQSGSTFAHKKKLVSDQERFYYAFMHDEGKNKKSLKEEEQKNTNLKKREKIPNNQIMQEVKEEIRPEDERNDSENEDMKILKEINDYENKEKEIEKRKKFEKAAKDWGNDDEWMATKVKIEPFDQKKKLANNSNSNANANANANTPKPQVTVIDFNMGLYDDPIMHIRQGMRSKDKNLVENVHGLSLENGEVKPKEKSPLRKANDNVNISQVPGKNSIVVGLEEISQANVQPNTDAKNQHIIIKDPNIKKRIVEVKQSLATSSDQIPPNKNNPTDQKIQASPKKIPEKKEEEIISPPQNVVKKVLGKKKTAEIENVVQAQDIHKLIYKMAISEIKIEGLPQTTIAPPEKNQNDDDLRLINVKNTKEVPQDKFKLVNDAHHMFVSSTYQVQGRTLLADEFHLPVDNPRDLNDFVNGIQPSRTHIDYEIQFSETKENIGKEVASGQMTGLIKNAVFDEDTKKVIDNAKLVGKYSIFDEDEAWDESISCEKKK